MAVSERSQARMLALQALCAYEAVGDSFRTELPRFLADDEILADLGILSPLADDLNAFARSLADGAWAERRALDDHLQRTATHWSLTRMTPVDRNVLRLGLFELLHMPQTPAAVVIDEAINLARQFGDTDSPAFVNGVLDALRREAEARLASAAAESTGAATADASAQQSALPLQSNP
jgi:N utilization substance protein B